MAKDPNLGDAQLHPAGYPDPRRVDPAQQAAHVPLAEAAPFVEVAAEPRTVAPEAAAQGITPVMSVPLGTGEPATPAAYQRPTGDNVA
jgi:hypothetical protein